jgi:hypothetical protein
MERPSARLTDRFTDGVTERQTLRAVNPLNEPPRKRPMTTEPEGDAERTTDPVGRVSMSEQFQRMLGDMDEVLRLQWRAEAGRDEQPADAFPGLTMLLDATLPRDDSSEARLARALHLEADTIRQFRRRELDPSELPAEPLATLGRALALDWPTFDLLIARDLTWFAEESPFAMLRSNTMDPREVRAALRNAWERDTLDEPDSLASDTR